MRKGLDQNLVPFILSALRRLLELFLPYIQSCILTGEIQYAAVFACVRIVVTATKISGWHWRVQIRLGAC